MAKFITHDADGNVIEQGKQAWKELRIGLFTGTSMADLLPGSRGSYTEARQKAIDEVVSEILTGKPVSGFKATKYIKEGIEKEPYARILYEARTDRFVDEIAFIRHDWMRCGASPDGVMPKIRRGVEFKSPKETTHTAYLRNPELLIKEYFAQVQTNLWLSAYGEWDLCSYHPDFPESMQLLIVPIKPDLAFHAKLEAEVAKASAEVNVIVRELNAAYATTTEKETT